MTEKELSQLRALNTEIAQKKSRLSELEKFHKGNFQPITGVACLRQTELTPETQTKITELRTQIENDLLRCLGMLAAMEKYISAIDDSKTRLILSLRYINGLSWQQVAFSIGEHDEQYPRRLCKAFFKKEDVKKDII